MAKRYLGVNTKTVTATIDKIILTNNKEGSVSLSNIEIQDYNIFFNMWAKYSRRFYNAKAKKGSRIIFEARIDNDDGFLSINHIRNIRLA